MILTCILTGILAAAASAAVTAILVRRREEKRLGEYQDRILQTQRDEVESIYRTMRGWRHDYHNHMQKINAHLKMNQVEEVMNYLLQLEEDLDSIDIAVRTGNVALDAIVSSKVVVARKKEIKVHLTARVPEKLTVSDVDICAIIGNLIDNAVAACERIKDGEKKFIRIYIGVFKEQLYLSVMNSTSETTRRSLKSFFRANMGEHGHGLRRIDTLTGKYDGYVNRKNEPGVFATEIMLPL